MQVIKRYLLLIFVWIIHNCSAAHGESPSDYLAEVQNCIEALNTNCVNKLAVSFYSTKKNGDLPCNYLLQSGIINVGDCYNRLPDVIANEMFAALRSPRESGMTRSMLLQFEERLQGGPHLPGEEGDRAVLYRMVAQRMLYGVPRQNWTKEEVKFGDVERAIRQRQSSSDYGTLLDPFIQRWKEVATETNRWDFFGEALLAWDRKQDLRWLINTLGGCRGLRLALRLGELDLAKSIPQAERCYEERAELAQRYAENGQATLSKQISKELLKTFPDYIAKRKQELDGRPFIDAVRPLVKSLVLAGDHQQALAEIEALKELVERGEAPQTGFGGPPFGFPEIASLFYSSGENERGDEIVEAHINTANNSWSRQFAKAFIKCQMGKTNCLEHLFDFNGVQLDDSAASAIYIWSLKAGHQDITPEIMVEKFRLNNSFMLFYDKLFFEILNHQYDASKTTLLFLINGEEGQNDQLQPSRIVLLLRLAVAMENHELATQAAQLILRKLLLGFSSQVDPYHDRSVTPHSHDKYLAEAAALFAQLERVKP